MRSEKSEWAYEQNMVLQKRLVDAEIVWDSCFDQSSSRAGGGGGHLWEIVTDEEDEIIGTPEDYSMLSATPQEGTQILSFYIKYLKKILQ